MSGSVVIPVEEIRAAIHRSLNGYSVPEEHILFVAETLVSTSLRGIDTHGVELLPTYLMELAGGRSLARPELSWGSKFPGLALLDAGNALGIVAGNVGIRRAINLAKEFGVSAVGIKNSNHFGAAGFYAGLAADAGLACFAFSNSDALVATSEGTKVLNGTNPIAFVANGIGQDSFHLDMATSQVAYSKVRSYLANSMTLSHGWAVDKTGVDSEISGTISALKPLGGYKGQGLAMVVQILCSLLVGGPFDSEITHLYSAPYSSGRKVGHFFLCINIEGLIDVRQFRNHLTALMNMFREDNQHGAPALVPGDKEREYWAKRSVEGIPVSAELYQILTCVREVGLTK